MSIGEFGPACAPTAGGIHHDRKRRARSRHPVSPPALPRAVTTRTSAMPRLRYLLGYDNPHTVVAAKAVADPYYDTITHLWSIVRVKKCAEHEMHGSWLRIDFSHNDVNVASSSVRLPATSSAISCSMAAWF